MKENIPANHQRIGPASSSWYGRKWLWMGSKMKTRRLRLVRPKWTMGTILLIVGWSAVVIWLNVTPRFGRYCLLARLASVHYGYPWDCIVAGWDSDSAPPYTSNRFGWARTPVFPKPSEHQVHYWPLAGNMAIGLLAVAVLTFASRYLVRAIVAGLRAFVGKPPPTNEKGPWRPNQGL